MDGLYFDSLTKSFSLSGSRRRFIAGLASGALGLAGFGKVAAEVCREAERTCTKHAHCCSQNCGAKDRTGRRRCECPVGTTNCDGRCVNPAVAFGTDPNNCGTCGHRCPSAPCRTAICVAGVCDTAPKVSANGTSCKTCTPAGTCQDGVCVCDGIDRCAGVTCTAQDQCHSAGVCNPATGVCSNPNAPNGTSCNDGNACTTDNVCTSGECGGGSVVTCTTEERCREAYCDKDAGCQTRLKETGTACGDGNACNGAEVCNETGDCVAGTPLSCGVCLRCNATNGSCEPDPTRVEQSCTPPGQASLCFGAYQCNASGVCAGVNPTVCAAKDQCHDVGTCDSSTGECSNPDKTNGAPCDDGDPETGNDVCTGGVCAGSDLCVGVVCESQDDCHVAGTCNPGTGECSNPAAEDGTTCDDGNESACTVGSCSGGTCVSKNVSCDDGNACTADSCDRETGCVHVSTTPAFIEVCTMAVCAPTPSGEREWVTVPTGQCPPCWIEGGACDPTDLDAIELMLYCPGRTCIPDYEGATTGHVGPDPCGVANNCREACGSYILAGAFYIDAPIFVDDDLVVTLNDTTLFDSTTSETRFAYPPIGPFTANAGDTITIAATNTYGDAYRLEAIQLYCADGSAAQWIAGGVWNTTYSPPTDEPFLTASLVIDI